MKLVMIESENQLHDHAFVPNDRICTDGQVMALKFNSWSVERRRRSREGRRELCKGGFKGRLLEEYQKQFMGIHLRVYFPRVLPVACARNLYQLAEEPQVVSLERWQLFEGPDIASPFQFDLSVACIS